MKLKENVLTELWAYIEVHRIALCCSANVPTYISLWVKIQRFSDTAIDSIHGMIILELQLKLRAHQCPRYDFYTRVLCKWHCTYQSPKIRLKAFNQNGRGMNRVYADMPQSHVHYEQTLMPQIVKPDNVSCLPLVLLGLMMIIIKMRMYTWNVSVPLLLE